MSSIPKTKQKTGTVTTTTQTPIVDAVTGQYMDITAMYFANTSASAVRIDIRDKTDGSVVTSFYVPAGDTRGATFAFPFVQTEANQNWTMTLSGAVTDVRFTTQAIVRS